MSHCRICGAPGYHDPCANCKSRGKATTSSPPSPTSLSTTPALDDSPRWRAFHNLAQRLQAKAQKHSTYDSNEWLQLQEVVQEIGIFGLRNQPETEAEEPAVPEPETTPESPPGPSPQSNQPSPKVSGLSPRPLRFDP